MRPLLAWLTALFLCALAPMASGHALDPGYLELREQSAGLWRVTWRAPDVAGRPMPISPRLPETCAESAPPDPAFDGRAWSSLWLTRCDGGLAGMTVVIDGLERTRTDTLLRFAPLDSPAVTLRLTAASAFVTLPADPGLWQVFTSYTGLGFLHILEGVDHLLFVLALLLLIRDWRKLLIAVTAFTVAHSLTLAASTLDLIRLPAPPVEATIALSIVFLAWELSKPPADRDPLSTRFPWLISFGFGLIHGMGFAGALREIGLPEGDIPLALLAFNIGVELGQLAFIAAALVAIGTLRRIVPLPEDLQRKGVQATSYGIGTLAAFWVFERVSGF